MSRRKLEWLKEILVTQMNHWVAIFFAITLMGLVERETPQLGLWIVVSIIPLLFCWIRIHVKRFNLFFLIHLFLFAIAVLLPIEDELVRVILGILVLWYTLNSLQLKLSAKAGYDNPVRESFSDDAGKVMTIFDHTDGARGIGSDWDASITEEVPTGKKGWDDPIPPVAACGIGGVTLLFHDYIQSRDWSQYYLLAILAYFVFYFLYYYLDQYLSFLVFNESSAANIPEKAILRTGVRQILVFAGLAAFLMLLSSHMEWLEAVLLLIARAFFFLFRILIGPGKEETPAETPQASAAPIEDYGIGAGSGAGIIWQILEIILIAAAVVAIVMAVLYGLLYGFRYLRDNFRRNFNMQDKVIDSYMDIRESCSAEVRDRRKSASERRWFAFWDTKEKIRRAFRKKILQLNHAEGGEKDYRYLNYRTAGECCEPLEDASVQKIYEKARYSDEICTSEDLKIIKTATKIQKN